MSVCTYYTYIRDRRPDLHRHSEPQFEFISQINHGYNSTRVVNHFQSERYCRTWKGNRWGWWRHTERLKNELEHSLEPKAGKIWRRWHLLLWLFWQHFWIALTFRKKVWVSERRLEWARKKIFLVWYLNLIIFRGTGNKRTENTKYNLNDVLSYQIIFWLISGISMHI